MDNNNNISTITLSINLHYLLLLVGLGGIIMTLLSLNLSFYTIIVVLPFIFIGGILIIRYPISMIFTIFTINYFILGITRYITIEGISLVMDILYIIALILIILHSTLYHNLDWRKCFHILTLLSLIWTVYCILEITNPTGVLEGWILSRGLIINGFLITIITSLLCTKYKTIKTLLFLYSLFTILAILKALMQKYIGFDSYENQWLNNGGATTHIIYSGIRYFSFFTDASNMGSNMGGAGVILGIASLYMKKRTLKIYYAIVAIASLYTMMLSGTRGAIIVPLAGLALYTVVSKQTKAMLIGSVSLVFIYIFFAFTLIGESNSTIRRMRTAFRPSEDASYIVRKENQKKLKEYLKNRPFGEGLGLSGDGLGQKVSKRFTTTIPTDSWYVKIWVETGIVGLSIYLGMIFITLARGAWIIMFNIRTTELKGILTGWLCAIFGMFLSAYGNSFWGQFPTMILAFMGMSFILNGKYFDKELCDKIDNYQHNKLLTK